MNYNKLSQITDKGHYVEFVDQDTGEIVKRWVEDKPVEHKSVEFAPRYSKEEEAEMDRLQRLIEELDSERYQTLDELADTKSLLNDLRIDMEEELGQLQQTQGDTAVEERAQDYGELENELQDKIASLRTKLADLRDKSKELQEQYDNIFYSK